MQELSQAANPFPGLRPFEPIEMHLFFGRDGQSEELLRRLKRTRFLTVVGTSGSGKSSLVRAGLLPALQGGLMSCAGSDWRIAMLRPGADPIGNLASALAITSVLGPPHEKSAGMHEALIETALRRSSLGLIELVRRARARVGEDGQPLFHDYENLLIVVDQFEEIFRFKQTVEKGDSKEDTAAFVKLLLEAALAPETNIYIVVTMRSDFLGDCAQFWGLPEAINNGQYLIPRMTRGERREAICGPVAVAHGVISEPLVNQLLNDAGDSPDQLPILQHALMRTWDYWQSHRRDGEPIGIPHYDAIGGMSNALSQHAEEAYEELEAAQKIIAEKMFKGLSEMGADNREVRRSMKVREICELTCADEAAVIAVIEIFRRRGRSFLMPPLADALTGTPIVLTGESLIDLSHESLIRNWERLKSWADEEAQSAHFYCRLAETSMLYLKKEAALWRDPDLQLALNWRSEKAPNNVWARRYHPEFEQANRFLNESAAARDARVVRDEMQRNEEFKRTRRTSLIVGVAFLISLIMGVGAYKAWDSAVAEAEKSRRLLYTADINVAARAYETNNFARGLDILEAYLPNPQQGNVPRFEWYYLWHLYHRERATLRGHSDAVFAMAYSPDGRVLATGSFDSTVKLWDVASHKITATFMSHSKIVYDVAFSPDGKTLATGSEDKTVRLWDTTSHQSLRTLEGHTEPVYAVAFSPDGRTLATGSGDKTVRLWDVASGKELATLLGYSNNVYDVAFSPDGKTLATGGADKTVRLWDVVSRRETSTLSGASSIAIAFSPDGKTLATGNFDSTVKLWNLASRSARTLKGHLNAVYDLAYSGDGKMLATGSADSTVKLWDTASGDELDTLTGHSDIVSAVVFSPDGKTLTTGSYDSTIKLWELSPHKDTALVNKHEGEVNGIAFSPDGRTLATASEDKTVRLWDAASGRELITLNGHTEPVYAVAFSPDGRTLATASEDKTVRLWDAASGEVLATLLGHTKAVHDVAFSRDSRTLATGSSDKTVRLWDVASGKELNVSTWDSEVYGVAFSPDGETLAIVGENNMVKLWNVASRLESATLLGHLSSVSAVVFSPDGGRLATGSVDNMVKLWDIASRQELVTFKVLSSVAVAFSPDGKTLATASTDKTVKLWDTTSRQELLTLKGHSAAVYAVTFSPDGRTLATAGADRMVKLWRGATNEEVAAQHK